jgi:hypothetical protein
LVYGIRSVIKNINQSEWTNILLKKLGLKHFDTILGLQALVNDTDSYNLIKAKLINTFNREQWLPKQQMRNSFDHLINIKQYNNETVEDYSHELKSSCKYQTMISTKK